ncbi:MAG TPA: DUF2842 domain-containing protein [Acetobacteraceae bacterium]|nr:DUF2842 domain-containing protein [Acetobacteraceae bacterium]
MARAWIAAVVGVGGFLAYVAGVVSLSSVLPALARPPLFWAVQFAFYAAAGILWVFPAKWLIVWVVRGRGA